MLDLIGLYYTLGWVFMVVAGKPGETTELEKLLIVFFLPVMLWGVGLIAALVVLRDEWRSFMGRAI